MRNTLLTLSLAALLASCDQDACPPGSVVSKHVEADSSSAAASEARFGHHSHSHHSTHHHSSHPHHATAHHGPSRYRSTRRPTRHSGMHASQRLVVYWLLVRPHGGGPDCRCYVDSTTYHSASVGNALPE